MRNSKDFQFSMQGEWSRDSIATKAITLWQPWATLVAIGAKQFETRSWMTHHRGPLVIHAAKRFKRQEILLCYEEPFRTCLMEAGYQGPKSLPLGRALCVIELRSIHPTSGGSISSFKELALFQQELAFGNFDAGRLAWRLCQPRIFEPISMRGRQGIWALTPDERAAVDAAIEATEDKS